MNKEIETQLKETVRTILTKICSIDDNGLFYEEIYTDYNDRLSDSSLKEICNADNPREYFCELLNDWYIECEWEYADNIIKQVLEHNNMANLVKNLDEDEVMEIIRDQFYVKYPEKHFLQEEVLVDLILDTGDMNSDFTDNTIGGHYNNRDSKIPEESSLLWLARQQGYKKSELKKAMADRGKGYSPLLQSIYNETEECSSHMNALTFLVKMTLEEYFNLQDAIAKEKSRNISAFLSERTGRGFMVLSQKTTCGLYDWWNGAGSLFDIKLEHDVRLPFRCINSALHDGCCGYSVREIYGCCSTWWSNNAIKKIHSMKKVA